MYLMLTDLMAEYEYERWYGTATTSPNATSVLYLGQACSESTDTVAGRVVVVTLPRATGSA